MKYSLKSNSVNLLPLRVESTRSDNIKIAIFCASLGGGGAERAMVNLVCGLSGRGLAVDLVLVNAEGPFLADVPPEVRVIDLKAQRVLASLPGLVRYLRMERPKVLLSALDHVNVVAIWARWLSRAPIRVIVSVQAPLTLSLGSQKGLTGKIMPSLIRMSYPKADTVVPVSQGVKRDLIGFIRVDASKVYTIYNPIINSQLYELGQENISHPWFKPQQPPVILAVGRLSLEKDYPTLIRAFQRVRQQLLVRLLILGEGDERSNLEALVRELGLRADIELPGFMPNPYALMKKASCFVLASKFEGFGNVLVEALAMGCPVVSTDCPTGPFEILNGGEWGRLVPIGDHEAMAAAIMAILNGEGNLNSLALGAYLQRFVVDEVASKYFNIFFQ